MTLIRGSIKYDNSIHSRAQLIKALLGKCVSWAPLMHARKNDLVVLNYHGTQKRFLNNFRLQVKFLQDRYHIISPSELEAFFKDGIKASNNKPSLLFNFDDGLRNNLYAAEVLHKYGIRALFFVVPEFVNCRHKSQAEFFQKNIKSMNQPRIDRTREDFMSWHELEGLVAAGHEVGSHSSSHIMRAAGIDCRSRQYEIVESQRMIADGLSLSLDQIRCFCGPVDSLLSVGRAEMTLIRDNYRFFFSTFPGSNLKPKNPYFIKRVHIEAFWMLSTVKFALSNLERIRWKRKAAEFQKILEKAPTV